MRVSSTLLADWILRTLHAEGPQKLSSLLGLLKSDPDLGYMALREESFESKVRACINRFSSDPECYFAIDSRYRWRALGEVRGSMELEPSIVRLSPSTPWLSVGHGTEAVYGLIVPRTIRDNYRQGLANYPLKIGRTSRPIAKRVLELQAGNHLDLHIGIVMLTSNAPYLEAFIHKSLEHRKLNGLSSQSEWFQTNLEDLTNLFYLSAENQLPEAAS